MKREKEIHAETRIIRLGFWLKRQPFDAFWNSKIEAAERFKKRLADFVESNNAHEVAPSFHAAGNYV